MKNNINIIIDHIKGWTETMDKIMESIRTTSRIGGTALTTLISALYKEMDKR